MLGWYDRTRRDLPWRRSPDFYRVWLSEIMLQQTRVEAVIPYYTRFLERFPDIAALACAREADVLAAWSGLGYYRRARSLHEAARRIHRAGRAPATHEEILALPGCGEYTAGAIASIALGLPHAAVDGNVRRAIARLANDECGIETAADALLDHHRPGDFNQAMMELGATVCKPGIPDCGACPVRKFCGAYAAGVQAEIPAPKKKPDTRRIALDLAIAERRGKVLLVRRGGSERRMADFWELPEKNGLAFVAAEKIGRFRHQIVNDRMEITAWRVSSSEDPISDTASHWFTPGEIGGIPLSTIARKALYLAFPGLQPPPARG